MNYLDELNEAQRAAVVHTEGQSLVIAGAGSGKTRVLTFRVAHLLMLSVPARSILALTFTNRAANEMKERIVKIVGEDTARHLWMGTFHSIFARILRIESPSLGYPSNYSIYDTIDSKNLIREIIRELKLDEQAYKPGDVLGRISMAKNNLITAQMYASSSDLNESDRMRGRPQLSEIFKRYAARCFKAGAMDFDDLLLNTFILLRDFPGIAEKYQKLFRYILVDEYQDTNYVQYAIVKKLGELHGNICVVGDDAQSIYSFRGARIENLLTFRNDYPEYSLFKLEKNYRSTQSIVNAANSIIAKNRDQIHKTVYSEKEAGESIEVIRTMTDTEEGFVVANAIQDIQFEKRIPFGEFAILYRTNAQSRIFEETLRKKNIPYKVYGSISFYQRKEIKDLLAYFRLVSNPSNDEALKRIINYPARGIGTTTLNRLLEISNERNVPVWELITHPERIQSFFNKGTLFRLSDFTGMINGFIAKKEESDAFSLAREIVSSSGILKDLYNHDSPEEISKFENIQELLNAVKEFTESQKKEGLKANLDEYLENVSLLTDLDTDKLEDREKVKIMTIHSAKGLEFDYVFIAGVEEDLFPSYMSVSNPKDLEEERRLFYVAVTRAREKVTITYTQTRYRWGTPAPARPSRFIEEIDPRYVKLPDDPIRGNGLWNGSYSHEKVYHTNRGGGKANTQPATGRHLTPIQKVRQAPPNDGFKPDDPHLIQVGMQVEHPRFGKGKVIHMEGESPNTRATVFFGEHGQKQLLLKFARLKITR